MTITEFESLPNRAEAVMTAMRPVEIEILEAQFTSCIGRPHPWSDKQLHRLRVLALQSAQLWRVCLPQESAAISYTPEGLVNESACGTELSISG
jgi:hypothetical protein